MKKGKFIGMFFVLVVIVFMLSWGIYGLVVKVVVDKVGDEKDKFKELVGAQVVIQGDTLMITDYDWIGNDLMLSNGNSISYEFGKKFLLKE